MVGLVKSSLYKTVGKGNLTWPELQDVVLDIEVALNNRPLSYVEDELGLPTLTPNSLMFVPSSALPELAPSHTEDKTLRKRAKYLKKCKDALWKRWTAEYIRGLRERQVHVNGKSVPPKIGEVYLIKSDEKNRGEWPMGVVTELFEGRDGVVRGARLRTSKGHMERAVQHLYPLELTCDLEQRAPVPLNAAAKEFRPKRAAAAAANLRIQQIAAEEESC